MRGTEKKRPCVVRRGESRWHLKHTAAYIKNVCRILSKCRPPVLPTWATEASKAPSWKLFIVS